jgi:hypothetical protein
MLNTNVSNNREIPYLYMSENESSSKCTSSGGNLLMSKTGLTFSSFLVPILLA